MFAFTGSHIRRDRAREPFRLFRGAAHFRRAPDKARMHFHFPFSAGDILWTLTFAGYLVLLVVLMGRDRIARFPWFTISIVLAALRILSIRLLIRRLPELTLDTIVLVMADLVALVGLLVLVEIARRAFGGVRRSAWLGGALAVMALGAVVCRAGQATPRGPSMAVAGVASPAG